MDAGSRGKLAWMVVLAGGLGAVLPALAGYREGMDALGVRDHVKARVEFEKEPTNPRALYELARMARQGLGAPRDDVRATALLRSASELGHAESRIDLAYALGNGTGTEKNPSEAVRLLSGLADAGNTEAMVVLARVLRYGWWEQSRDEARSAVLAQRAMDAGDDEGRLLYALALSEGIGLAKDEARAAEMLRVAADRGHLESQVEFARMLTFGVGITKDEAAGTAMYQKAADRDSRVAQYSVGMAYLRGRGVPRDEKAGVRWIDASARQGWAWAQLQLADMFRLGTSVPRLRNEAFFWYSVAARGTTAAAAERANQLRATLAREMSDADIGRLQARAEAFRPTPGFRPWLMVLNAQEDSDRMKLGLPGGLRSIEISRQLPDDSVKVTPTLFAEVKGQFRSHVETGISGGRFRLEATVVDDDKSWAIVRSGVGDSPRFDAVAVALVLVKEKVLLLAFTGFAREQKGDLSTLVRLTLEEVLSANRSGFFN